MRKKPRVPFSQKFPGADPMALHLLERLLAFDPKDRPTAAEALTDPYFTGLANSEREPIAQPISKLEFEFERRKLAKDDVRELIYREVLLIFSTMRILVIVFSYAWCLSLSLSLDIRVPSSDDAEISSWWGSVKLFVPQWGGSF
jgi:serine/threonine protein kinase